MEMKLNKAFKYRLKPSLEQKIFFCQAFGCSRKVYNLLLSDYNETGKLKTPACYKNDYKYLKETDSMALANARMDLQKAINNHYNNPKKFGKPQFKKKKYCESYTTNKISNSNNIRMDNKYLRLPKIGKVRIVKHRIAPANYILKHVTISRESDGHYYASVLYEYIKYYPDKQVVKNALGIDYSSPNFMVTSNGLVANPPHSYRKYEEKLKREQRKLSRKEKGSNNYEKQVRKIGKIHTKIAHIRKDFIEKASTEITNQCDVICLESLDLHAQAQTLKFGKSVSDNGFGLFRTRLEQKCKERDKIVVYVGKWFPSSKTCHKCGYYYQDLSLGESEWFCPDCNTVVDRDYNASLNIRDEGLRVLLSSIISKVNDNDSIINLRTVGLTGFACSFRKYGFSIRQEAVA